MLYPILAFVGLEETESLAAGRGRHSEGGTRKRNRNITKAEKRQHQDSEGAALPRYQCRGSRGGCEPEEGSEPSSAGLLTLLNVLSAECCGVTSADLL